MYSPNWMPFSILYDCVIYILEFWSNTINNVRMSSQMDICISDKLLKNMLEIKMIV